MTVSDAWTVPTGATLDLATDDVLAESNWDAAVSDLLFNYNRRVVELTNRSGGGVIAGDVVVVDTANDDSFTTTTTANNEDVLGIAQETIADAALGKIMLVGLADVNVDATTARGDWIATGTTVKQGTPTAAKSSGAFAVAVRARTGAGLVKCLLLGTAAALAIDAGAFQGSVSTTSGTYQTIITQNIVLRAPGKILIVLVAQLANTGNGGDLSNCDMQVQVDAVAQTILHVGSGNGATTANLTFAAFATVGSTTTLGTDSATSARARIAFCAVIATGLAVGTRAVTVKAKMTGTGGTTECYIAGFAIGTA